MIQNSVICVVHVFEIMKQLCKLSVSCINVLAKVVMSIEVYNTYNITHICKVEEEP